MHIKDEIAKKFGIHKTQLSEANQKFGGVYVAKVAEDDAINLEVEVSDGTIAFSLNGISADDIDDAYVELTDYLESNGISVYEDAGEWEDAKYQD